MTKNYSLTENVNVAASETTRSYDIDMEKTNGNSDMPHRGSSDAVSPGSILTASEILKAHEDAFEERRRSHDGELHLPPSVATTIEVLGGPHNVRAERLAANLAALMGKTDNAQNATGRNAINANWQNKRNPFEIDAARVNINQTFPRTRPLETNSANHPAQVKSVERMYSKNSYDKTRAAASSGHKHAGAVISSVFAHADSKYTDSHIQMIAAIRQAHPNGRLIPLDLNSLDIFAFCFSGHAELQMLTSVADGTGISTYYFWSPSKRTSNGGSTGLLSQVPQWEGGTITYKGVKWNFYYGSWQAGFETIKRGYIVHDGDAEGDALVEDFAVACGTWTVTPTQQMWVFDRGYWQLDAALYASVMHADWADIILPEELKKNVLDDMLGFFGAEDTYRGMSMPWKRGIVFYGPPGNGKTITLKAIMKTLYTPSEDIPPLPVPCLYVKTLASYGPPEFAIKDIFQKARQQSPCLLIWEDLDSIINDSNRSFFLNELDGLEDNDGILVIATTNHLDRLDPGIIKRPSRFDRKYLFDNPAPAEQVRYVEYWRAKLSDTPIEFSDKLVKKLADLMVDFSFAYMKEAFVSTLLVLAGRRNNKGGGDEWASKFESTIIQQIKQLREQLEAEQRTEPSLVTGSSSDFVPKHMQ
ncbi:Paraplegin [Drechslerella dactyloides]|uniref:Paraplegin n=1 Tax=Drechslerella dactyloides TaxID=74499 RepID=A0AAD6NK78_DREDA|nr:Paraplegin [Drechslerella dactyloides]